MDFYVQLIYKSPVFCKKVRRLYNTAILYSSLANLPTERKHDLRIGVLCLDEFSRIKMKKSPNWKETCSEIGISRLADFSRIKIKIYKKINTTVPMYIGQDLR